MLLGMNAQGAQGCYSVRHQAFAAGFVNWWQGRVYD
jgi:hypothetical protein